MLRYYLRDGTPCSMLEWAEKLNDDDYRVIAQTVCTGGQLVSTVWLGLDHSFSRTAPVIFETLVFASEGTGGEVLDGRRYATEAEARAGHCELVERWEHKATAEARLKG